MSNRNRVIALIDMDCFYAQVEQRLQPHLWGKPVAVVQYNGILAVSYEARKYGVKRFMNLEKVKEICPEIALCNVPSGEHSDKADLKRYRDASDDVFKVLNGYDSRVIVERASIDEAFLDLTELVDFIIASEDLPEKYSSSLDLFPTTYIADGNDLNEEDNPEWQYDREKTLKIWIHKACNENNNDLLRLAVGAELVEQIRARIKEETQFRCSAGIASNKMMAKLVCSRHKPGQQTVVPDYAFSSILRNTKISSVRNLGGKLGRAIMGKFSIQTMGELSAISLEEISEQFPAQAKWIHAIANGMDEEEVRERDKAISIAVSKNFTGSSALFTVSAVQSWLDGLMKELVKRLTEDQIKNQRTACTLHVGCTMDAQFGKSFQIVTYSSDALYNSAWAIIRNFNKAVDSNAWEPPIVNISLSACRFRDGVDVSSKRITDWICQKAKALVSGEEDNLPSGSFPIPVTDSTDDEAGTSRGFDFIETVEQKPARYVPPEKEFLPESLEDIPEDLLADMPEDIKKELTLYYGQRTPNSGKKQKPEVVPKKKRGAKKRPLTKVVEQPAAKKISDFFTKKE